MKAFIDRIPDDVVDMQGVLASHRARLRAIARMSVDELRVERVRIWDGAVLKTLGGEGSGNFGHAGRPGEVGGSGPGGAPTVTGDAAAKATIEHTLGQLPQGLRNDIPAHTIEAFTSAKEARNRIDDYLLEHYGMTEEKTIRALTDRERKVIITTTDKATLAAQLAHSLVHRGEDSEFIRTAEMLGETDPSAAFRKIVYGVVHAADAADPARWMHDAVVPAYRHLIRKWGWDQ